MAASPEALLISAILRSGDAKTAMQQGIQPEMFDLYHDEWVYLAKYMDKFGSVPAKSAWKQKWPDFTIYAVDNVVAFCDEVKEEYARATMVDILDRSVDLMMKGQINDAMEGLQTDMLRIQASIQDQTEDYDMVVDWQSTYDDTLRRAERVRTIGHAGVPSGIDTLDMATGGFQPGWVNIVGARLGAGKTWTMVDMACKGVMAGYSSLFYTLEQSKHQIAYRTHTTLSNLMGWEGGVFRHMDLMRGKNIDLMGYKDFLEQLEDMVPGRLIINDASRGRVSPMTVAAAIEREEPDIVFIDYLTLMAQKGDGDWRSVSNLSADLQQLAQRYQIPFVIASQLNRTAIGSDDADPGTLSRSDSVGHDADSIIMVSKKTQSVRKMTLAKFRHGPDGDSWFMKWKPNTGDITEISGDEAGELMEADKEVD